MIRARIFAIACGYEDADDLDLLRCDPAFRFACGRLPETGRDLCSQPTLSRLENAPRLRDVIRRPQGAVQPPTPLDLLTAIGGTKSLAMLDGFARAIWADWGAGRLSDEQASALAETLEGRKREVRGIDTVASRAPQVAEAARKQGRLSHFPPKRKAARSPDRRTLAAPVPNRRKR